MSDRKYRQRGYQDSGAPEKKSGGGEKPVKKDTFGPRPLQMPGTRDISRCAQCGTVLQTASALPEKCPKCGFENPHGHNYKIRVTLAGEELDKAGLLLDFKDLRDVMRHTIERLDHQMINDIEPFTVINPSAENLAKYFYDESNSRLQAITKGRVRVKDVTVFETDTTTAKYSE